MQNHSHIQRQTFYGDVSTDSKFCQCRSLSAKSQSFHLMAIAIAGHAVSSWKSIDIGSTCQLGDNKCCVLYNTGEYVIFIITSVDIS